MLVGVRGRGSCRGRGLLWVPACGCVPASLSLHAACSHPPLTHTPTPTLPQVRLVDGSQNADKKRTAQAAALRPPMRDALNRAYATGRRKTAVARVWVRPGEGSFSVNGRTLADYFHRSADRVTAMEPLISSQTAGAFDVMLTVEGGGLTGQAGAIKHGLAGALSRYDPYLKPGLQRGACKGGLGRTAEGCSTGSGCSTTSAHSPTVSPYLTPQLASSSATRVPSSARSPARRRRAASFNGLSGKGMWGLLRSTLSPPSLSSRHAHLATQASR